MILILEKNYFLTKIVKNTHKADLESISRVFFDASQDIPSFIYDDIFDWYFVY